MEAALKALSTNGVVGAILAVAFALLALTIGVLGMSHKDMISASIKQQEKFSAFMEKLTEALAAINLNSKTGRTDCLGATRQAENNISLQVEHVAWAVHDKAKLEIEAALGVAVEKISAEVTGAANSIRAGMRDFVQAVENQRLRDENAELSRPHDVGDGRVLR